MRYLSSILLVMVLAMPAFANSSFCPMTGPQNCAVQVEDELIDLTKNTIHNMEARNHTHAFPTQNDAVTSMSSQMRQHAALQKTTIGTYSNTNR